MPDSNGVRLLYVRTLLASQRLSDAAGRLNQQVAAEADTVLMMVAGLPLKVK